MLGYSHENMPKDASLITVRAAAERLNYTVQHTRLLIRRGQIQAIKVGRDWLIRKDVIGSTPAKPARIIRALQMRRGPRG